MAENPKEILQRPVVLILHTIIIYLCALRLSPWAVGHWFKWVLPMLKAVPSSTSGDWYLQHLELVTICPAFISGYLISRKFGSTAKLAWVLPTLVLVFRMLLYRSTASILSPVSAFDYFFEIQHKMTTIANWQETDPFRVLAQMTVTAPFYAGIAYSIAAIARRRIHKEIWRKH